MSKYAYFLGCITPNRYPGIEAATRKVLNGFGIEILEMNGASCCPAPGVFGSFDLLTWAVIAARNITIAEELGADIVVTCNGCYATLQEANYLLTNNADLRRRANEALAKIGRMYKGTIRVKHVIQVLRDDIGLKRIESEVKTPLKSVNVAAHYGCHFLKPSKIRQQGSTERPTVLDDLVMVLGAKSVDYQDKMMCCGAGGGVRAGRPDVALDMTREKVENMTEAGADCVTTPCAFCHLQFDRGMSELAEKMGERYELPVIFITQLIGLALGMRHDELGITENVTQVKTLLDRLPQAT